MPVRWMAPESLERGEWTEKSDVWAFGVTMWEVFSNAALPFEYVTSDEVCVCVCVCVCVWWWWWCEVRFCDGARARVCV